MSFMGVLSLILIILKLLKVIAISWLWVFMPVAIEVVLSILFLVIAAIVSYKVN